LAVASVGRGIEFGHPYPETLALLARHQVPLPRTDIDGTVTVVSDGRRWGVSSHPQLDRGPSVVEKRVGVGVRGKKRPGSSQQPGRPVNINTASLKELEALPGVGPTIARRIIEGRLYRSVDDLLRVKGVGEKRLEEIRPFVTAR
jgi:competence ComEA-like helix-hairpin-helix protein